jgi:hypothetical protein
MDEIRFLRALAVEARRRTGVGSLSNTIPTVREYLTDNGYWVGSLPTSSGEIMLRY